LRKKSNAQVLIDARIIEVELDDSFQSGIDWNGVFKNAAGIATNFGTLASFNSNGFFTAGVSGTNFNGLINLVQTFGTTRVLSAPRVTVLNNQTAVMKVATNQVYFVTQAQFTTTTNANGASITTNPIYTSTPLTVPVGLVMTVQPSIDAESNRVTMTLRPTISRIVGEVNDPSISLNAAVAGVTASVQSQVPVLAVREMDSVIQLHSGEIAILGGLMQDSSINTDQGVPGMADISYLGNLFKSRNNNGQTSELVILLRATISDQPSPDSADDNLYHYYNRDPRPLKIPNTNPKLLPDDDDDDDPTS
jgi:general secretion pathway protein D